MRKSVQGFALTLGLAVATIGTAAAAQFVSIRGENVNLRTAPSLRSQVTWQLGSGYPLKVLARKGHWLKVIDFENDRGWVASRLTNRTPHIVIKSSRANIRSGPSTRRHIVGHASYGEVFRVLEKRRGWVHVKSEDKRAGWVARSLVWGD